GKSRFLLNAPLDRRWSLIGVDCDEVAFRAFQELISAKPNRTDIALCGDLVKGISTFRRTTSRPALACSSSTRSLTTGSLQSYGECTNCCPPLDASMPASSLREVGATKRSRRSRNAASR